MEQPTTLEGYLSQPFSPDIPINNHNGQRHPAEVAARPEQPEDNQETAILADAETDENVVERLNEAADEMLLKEYEELYELMMGLLVWAAEKLPDDAEKRRKLTAFSVFSSVITTLIFYKLTGKAINVDTELLSGLIGALRTALMSIADDMVTTRVKPHFGSDDDKTDEQADQPEDVDDDRAA